MDKSIFLLLILSLCDRTPVRGKTKFLKLLYIAGRKLRQANVSIDFYEFRRHYYGPYAEKIVVDLEDLIRRDLVNHTKQRGFSGRRDAYSLYEENVYQITGKGQKKLEESMNEIPYTQKVIRAFTETKAEYNNMPLSLLIQEIYSKYPQSQ